ncbi:MAG: PD-(D/E)XK nuclease family protein [Candidatus Pacearchaeota archaeon]|nr:PD-(D/E)XK nuclease family protein [Candidatus Pacearchaeota archaeon]
MSFRLSPSSLNLMQECPRCFWLTQHKVWSRPVGVFPSLPSGMDLILKKHFDKFRDKGELPPELRNTECEKNNCKLFKDNEKLKIWRNNLKGISWTDKDGNVLHGAVDNLLQKGKKLIVLDYKTRGFELKEDTPEHYQNQLNIYNFLLRMNDYETEDYAFLLFYVPEEVAETGEVIFDTTLKKMDIDVRKAGELFEDAIRLLNGDCPKKSCEWCVGR